MPGVPEVLGVLTLSRNETDDRQRDRDESGKKPALGIHEAREHLAVERVDLRRRQVVTPGRAVHGDLALAALTHDFARREIGASHRHHRDRHDRRRRRQRRQPLLRQRAAGDQQRAADDRHIGDEKDAVVHARQHLAGGTDPEQHAVAQPPGVEQAMERPQRQRNELRLLQLQMRVVIDAVRRKCEDDAGENGSAGVVGQAAHEQRDAHPREREAREEHQVVDQNRLDAEPLQRRGEQARHQQRLGIRQGVALRVEDVGVEDVRGRVRQLMRNPRQHPGHHQRIGGIVNPVGHTQDLRVGHHRGKRYEERQRQRQKRAGT